MSLQEAENVLMRLALTDDAALEKVLEKLLPALISNITAAEEAVKAKVHPAKCARMRFEVLSQSGFAANGGTVTRIQAVARCYHCQSSLC